MSGYSFIHFLLTFFPSGVSSPDFHCQHVVGPTLLKQTSPTVSGLKGAFSNLHILAPSIEVRFRSGLTEGHFRRVQSLALSYSCASFAFFFLCVRFRPHDLRLRFCSLISSVLISSYPAGSRNPVPDTANQPQKQNLAFYMFHSWYGIPLIIKKINNIYVNIELMGLS